MASILLGGVLLGSGVGGVVLAALAWAALDPCTEEGPIPMVMVVMVMSVAAVACAAVVYLFEARPVRVWLAGGSVVGLASALWMLLSAHAVEAALDCTWKVNPAIMPVQSGGRAVP